MLLKCFLATTIRCRQLLLHESPHGWPLLIIWSRRWLIVIMLGLEISRRGSVFRSQWSLTAPGSLDCSFSIAKSFQPGEHSKVPRRPDRSVKPESPRSRSRCSPAAAPDRCLWCRPLPARTKTLLSLPAKHTLAWPGRAGPGSPPCYFQSVVDERLSVDFSSSFFHPVSARAEIWDVRA